MKTLSENAIKDRLRNLANEQGKSVNELLKKLYLERFLARLAKSNFKNQLIFKGGYLLRYYIKIGRETKDKELKPHQYKNKMFYRFKFNKLWKTGHLWSIF